MIVIKLTLTSTRSLIPSGLQDHLFLNILYSITLDKVAGFDSLTGFDDPFRRPLMFRPSDKFRLKILSKS